MQPNDPEPDALFTPEEVLGGLPGRQANSLLFLIKSRTAHLVARSRDALEPYLTERTVEERDLAFLDAFALGRDPPLRPTIQDLEAHAADWSPLVEDTSARVRATLAHQLSRKYALPFERTEGIRRALGLDRDELA